VTRPTASIPPARHHPHPQHVLPTRRSPRTAFNQSSLSIASLSPPSPLAAPTPSPQTPTYSPHDLQRQQEVRDRLSGTPGSKASSLIEMYPEKERQASSSKRSPGKTSGATSQQRQVEPPALAAKNLPRFQLHLRLPSRVFLPLTPR
jgi:hypothetical protein